MVTLGIVFSHDGTLSIVRDGQNVYSCGEERLNRCKSYIGFPFSVLREVVNSGLLRPEEVEAVAIPSSVFAAKAAETFAFVTTEEKVYFDLQNDVAPAEYELVDDGWRSIKSASECRNYVEAKIQALLGAVGISAPIEFYDHHLSHAASAYYSSGINRALAITMDGEGDGLSATVNVCEDGIICRVSATDREHSAGYIYSAVTRRCGFKMSRHEGKITGLAAYGDANLAYERLSAHVSVADGCLRIHGLRENTFRERILRRGFELFGKARSFGAVQLIEQFSDLSNEDLAAGVQKLLEDKIAEIIEYWVNRTGIRDVVVAGGVFANVKFNQRIGELECVDSLFVFPDMGDGGTAYGAAMHSYVRKNGFCAGTSRLSSVYLGPEYTDCQIEAVLKETHGVSFVRSTDIAYDSAKYIAEGCIVGWFQGRMEYGPRALGNRSILASASDKRINKWLNDRMRRTEFMPFAPSCLFEWADDVFVVPKEGLKRAAEFMTVTFRMKDEWVERAPAVAHLDKTARPQLVRSEVNPLYHRLLSEYTTLTGIPLVINTSFNVHEEPIVCNPREAIKALSSGVIDILAIGNFIAKRED